MNFDIKINGRTDFIFPTLFLETISSTPPIDIEPWWFIIYEEGDINYWYHTLKALYPKRELIPFAKFNANDDIACFDGNDNSGSPRVYIIHAYASDGWELHGTYENFEQWLSSAIKTHLEWDEE